MAISLQPAVVNAPGAMRPILLTFWVSSKSSPLSSSDEPLLLPVDELSDELFFFFFNLLEALAAIFFLTLGSGSIPVPANTLLRLFRAIALAEPVSYTHLTLPTKLEV